MKPNLPRGESGPAGSARAKRLKALLAILVLSGIAYLAGQPYLHRIRQETRDLAIRNALMRRESKLAARRRRQAEAREEELYRRVQAGRAGPREYSELSALVADRSPNAAGQMLLEGTTRYPSSVSLWATLGLLQQQQGRVEQALISFRRANRLAPGNRLVAAALADLYTSLGWAREARLVLRPVRREQEDPSVAMAAARLAIQTADSRGALRLLAPICSAPGAPVEAFVLRGQARSGEEAHAAAARNFERALAMAPDRVEIRVQLADELLSLGTPAALKRAEEVCREGLRLPIPAPPLQRALGMVLARAGRQREALDYLLPLARKEHYDEVLLFVAAACLRTLGGEAEARDLAARARTARESAERISRFRSRADLHPGDTRALLGLAREYLARGNPLSARLELSRALDYQHDLPVARQLLKELNGRARVGSAQQ